MKMQFSFDSNLFNCGLVMFFNRVFRQQRFDQFLLFLASLIKNNKYFLGGIKTFEISAYVENHIFSSCIANRIRRRFLITRFLAAEALGKNIIADWR